MNGKIITFIGGGNMATSIIGGLVSKGVAATDIRVSEPSAEARQRLSDTFGVVTHADNATACADADAVVLAVKPQIMKAVALDLAPALSHRPLVVSIAAGIPVAALQQWLGNAMPLVRCMPNTPALVHQGASGLYASPAVDTGQRELAGALFAAVGDIAWVDNEDKIDAVTAVSGSGPAYFFLFMETMQQAALELGLSADSARRLTLQTALGAATMAIDSDVDVAELRRRVTSPGGTTARAIDAFEQGNLQSLVTTAMTAARDRAQEMAREFSE